MTTDDIAKLAEIMAENDLSELSLEEEGTKLHLERGARVVESVAPVAVAAAPVAVAVPQALAESSVEAVEAEAAPCIASPIVGTFYAAPSPDADVFAKVGDRVDADTVVCIIEAMKVMNEIKAELSGVIKRVLVENSQPVEFGQPLFEIDPDA